MRIPLDVQFFAGGLRPMITFTIRSPTLSLFGFAKAIIDTGSPATLLGCADVERMRISQIQMQKLTGEEKEVNLGGSQIKTRLLTDVEITIGGQVKVCLPVQVPVKMIRGNPPPSIIGVDFLTKGTMRFFFYPSKKEAYLEIDDLPLF